MTMHARTLGNANFAADLIMYRLIKSGIMPHRIAIEIHIGDTGYTVRSIID